MKKIIKGARYDTASARLLARWQIGAPVAGQLSSYRENLYRTKSGKYFIHGCGGPASPYGSCKNGEAGQGEAIRPIDEETAKQLAKEHCDPKQFDAFFSQLKEGRIQRTIYLSPAANKKLEDLKKSTGLTAPQIIDQAILSYQPE